MYSCETAAVEGEASCSLQVKEAYPHDLIEMLRISD